MNELPEDYEADTEEFEQLYVLAWLVLLKALMTFLRLPQNPTSTQLLQTERQVNGKVSKVFKELETKAVNLSNKQITEAYKAGISYYKKANVTQNLIANNPIGTDTKISTDKDIIINNTHKQRLDKILTQSQGDLLLATHNTQENVKRLVRQVVSKEMTEIGQGGRIGKRSNMAKRVEDQLKEQFIKNGFKDADVAIIDRANRKWKLRTYSSMAVRTKMNMAYIDAIREEALQNGTDLAIISTKPDTKDECLNYEGMIISLNGRTAGYPTYEELKRSKKIFHPNCGHFVRPIGSLAFVPREQLEIHKRKLSNHLKG